MFVIFFLSTGQTLTERNPKYEKVLDIQKGRIDKARCIKEREMFQKQRNFFIKSVFDAEDGLRLVISSHIDEFD